MNVTENKTVTAPLSFHAGLAKYAYLSSPATDPLDYAGRRLAIYYVTGEYYWPGGFGNNYGVRPVLRTGAS